MSEKRYWEIRAERDWRLSRRRLLKGTGLAGAGTAAAFLVGCGNDDDSVAPGPGNGVSDDSADDAGNRNGQPDPTQPSGDVNRGGEVSIGLAAPFNSLDPHLGRAGTEHGVFWNVTESMVDYDENFVARGRLAEGWEQVDDLTVRFSLRPGITFHDGSELNADVVKMNLDRVLDPEMGSAAYGQMSVIESVDAPDPETIVINLSHRSAPIVINMADRGGQILSGEQLMNASDEEIARGPIGTGPFTFEEWHDGSHVLLNANPTYWRGDDNGGTLPYLDSLRFRFFPSATVMVTSVETGETHIGSGVGGAEYDQIQGHQDLTSLQVEGYGTLHLRLNLAVMDDIRVRRALVWAMDRNAISQAAYRGHSTVGVSPIGPAYGWAFYPELQDQVFQDLDRAREELAAAGYDESNPLELTLEHRTTDRLAPQVIQAQFAEIGINLTLQPDDSQSQFHQGVGQMFHTTPAGFSLRPDPDGQIFELYHGAGTSNVASRGEAAVDGVFSADPELDSLIEQASATYDLDERRELYHQAEEIIVFDGHGVFHGWSSYGWALRDAVQAFDPGAEGKGRYDRVWLA